MTPASPPGRRRSLSIAEVLCLFAIVAVGLGVRALYLQAARQTPGYVWEDPDGYMGQALKLADPVRGWTWTFDAVTYDIEGRRHALPPGYSVFLSVFALFPGFPLTAQIAQVLLSAVSICLVFALGRLVHTSLTGLLAAAAYALWVPTIFNAWSTSQETVYLPLMLLAFSLLAWAIAGDGRAWRFVPAGVALGLAALTRSMPLFFILPASALHIMLATDRRAATRQVVMWIAGFLIVVAPYTAALSNHFGRLTVIDTHGSIHLETAASAAAPGLGETLIALGTQVAADPWTFVTGTAERARTLLYVNGGRILQIYVAAGTETRARGWKLLVHAGADALLVLSVILAPIGAVLVRERRLAALLVLWAAVNIAVASLGGFGGARLRAPFEPFMAILGAAVLVGSWRRPPMAGLVGATALAVIAAYAVIPQIPRSLAARADYGVTWPSILSRPAGRFVGRAGLNIVAASGSAQFTLAPTALDPEGVRVEVLAHGRSVKTLLLKEAAPTPVVVDWPEGGMAFVEIVARTAGTGSPAPMDVAVSR